MEKSFNRSHRIAQELQKKISFILHHVLKDPRIKIFISVSEVVVSHDLSHAQVFVSFLPMYTLDNIKKVLVILNHSTGYIRKVLFRDMRLRIIPNIFFYHDNSLLKGHKISQILDNLRKDDNICL